MSFLISVSDASFSQNNYDAVHEIKYTFPSRNTADLKTLTNILLDGLSPTIMT